MELLNELWFLIFSFLPFKMMLNCRLINKAINYLYLKNIKFHLKKCNSNSGLIEFSQKAKIISLNLCWNKLITDQSVSRLINLTSLDLYCNNLITDQAISNLPNVKIIR